MILIFGNINERLFNYVATGQCKETSLLGSIPTDLGDFSLRMKGYLIILVDALKHPRRKAI